MSKSDFLTTTWTQYLFFSRYNFVILWQKQWTHPDELLNNVTLTLKTLKVICDKIICHRNQLISVIVKYFRH